MTRPRQRVRKDAFTAATDKIILDGVAAAQRAATTALSRPSGDGPSFLVVRIDEIVTSALTELATQFAGARQTLQRAGVLKSGKAPDVSPSIVTAALLAVVDAVGIAAAKAVFGNADAATWALYKAALTDCEKAWVGRLTSK